MSYKLGSLFDGSGGFPLAGALCGVEPVWAAEIEPYPIAVTRERFNGSTDNPLRKLLDHHNSNMKLYMTHLGNICEINGAEIEPVDIITFGSPCQDLSVAGKRAGLKHEANGDEETTRSGLFMEAVRIIKEMRKATNGEYPRFALWENVPGAFSSNRGEDFRVVCEELIKIVEPSAFMPPVPQNGWAYADSYVGDGWSLAYRVFDAQYWGVPQRRRRIHLVVDFRGECAREVLFEREGVRGYFAQGGKAWETAPTDAQGGTGADDREGESINCLTPWDSQTRRCYGVDGVAPTLCAGAETSGQNQQAFCVPVGDVRGRQLDAVGFDGYNSSLTGDKSSTLGVNCGMSTGRNGVLEQVPYLLKIRSGCEGGGKGALIQKDKSATLATNNDQYLFQPVAYSFDSLASNSMKSSNPHSGCRQVEVGKTLDCTDPNPSKNQGGIAIVQQVFSVENHPVDSRVGTGGGNVPMVMEPAPVYCLQGNGIDRADTAGCNGKGWKEDTCYTLNTIDRPAVVYAVDQGGGKSGANVSENTAPTLCTTHGGEPAVAYSINHQGGNVEQIIEEKTGTLTAAMNSSGNNKLSVAYGLDRASFNQGENAKFDFSILEEQQHTLTARGPGAISQPLLNASKASFFMNVGDEGVADTLVATDYKDPQLIAYPAELHEFVADHNADAPHQQDLLQAADGISRPLVAATHGVAGHHTKTVIYEHPHYIVRRLTPTECARLQGFADWWAYIEPKDDLTDEEYRFWLEVRNTHATINGKAVKDYTKAQILTWYNKLYTDSAEYKMWGNGIALPPALYCMQGMVDVLSGKENTDQGYESQIAEPTDLSDAPEYIKAEIIENAKKLEERETVKETTEEETMEQINIEEQATNKETFCAVAQLRRLAEERKALANLRPEDPRFSNDVRAIEYAVTVLEAVGL